ncbi:MAG TPA: hypothetical protein VI643_05210 [Planctomycetota bacterium]|nr:hypothetical protein [Planctomycetota bacterium]
MRVSTLLPILLLSACFREGSSYSHKKMEEKKLFAFDLDGRVGQDMRGLLYYYFPGNPQYRGHVRVVDPLPADLNEEFMPYSQDTWIKGKPKQAGSWTLRVEIADPKSRAKVQDKFTISVK